VVWAVPSDLLAGPFQTVVSRHEDNIATPLFRRKVSPVEAVLGESSDLRVGIMLVDCFSRVEIRRIAHRENLAI